MFLRFREQFLIYVTCESNSRSLFIHWNRFPSGWIKLLWKETGNARRIGEKCSYLFHSIVQNIIFDSSVHHLLEGVNRVKKQRHFSTARIKQSAHWSNFPELQQTKWIVYFVSNIGDIFNWLKMFLRQINRWTVFRIDYQIDAIKDHLTLN